MRFPVVRSSCIALSVLGLASCSSAQAPLLHPQPKKVIEFGWDTPSIQDVAAHIGDWQDRPFDGIVFSLADNGGQIFKLETNSPAEIKQETDLLRSVHWGRFTDNFIQLTCPSDMDWTSDSDWSTIIEHVRLCADAAKAAGCAGFVLDPEHYSGIDPWTYSAQQQSKSLKFEQYQKIVRRRGQEFIRAVQGSMPNAKILMFYSYSELVNELGPIHGREQQDSALAGNVYGLMPSFMDGILDGAKPGIQLIDGNEGSYWYTGPQQFQAAYGVIHGQASLYVSAELRRKFAAHIRAAQAIYTDYDFNLQQSRFPSAPAVSMSAEQRAELFESNLYYGLSSSDEYDWIYSENLNWWRTPLWAPPGMIDAIAAAKSKAETGQSLGFDTGESLLGANVHRLLAKIGL